jgi:hypothetical protein
MQVAEQDEAWAHEPEGSKLCSVRGGASVRWLMTVISTALDCALHVRLSSAGDLLQIIRSVSCIPYSEIVFLMWLR